MMDYDGRNRKTVAENGVVYPFALAFFQDKLYWTDWKTWCVIYIIQFSFKHFLTFLLVSVAFKLLELILLVTTKMMCGSSGSTAIIPFLVKPKCQYNSGYYRILTTISTVLGFIRYIVIIIAILILLMNILIKHGNINISMLLKLTIKWQMIIQIPFKC